MRAFVWTSVIIVLLSFAAQSCGDVATLHPPKGIGTGYPCGYQGKQCSAEGRTWCCLEDEACGGMRTIDEDPMGSYPVGSCPFVGPERP